MPLEPLYVAVFIHNSFHLSIRSIFLSGQLEAILVLHNLPSRDVRKYTSAQEYTHVYFFFSCQDSAFMFELDESDISVQVFTYD